MPSPALRKTHSRKSAGNVSRLPSRRSGTSVALCCAPTCTVITNDTMNTARVQPRSGLIMDNSEAEQARRLDRERSGLQARQKTGGGVPAVAVDDVQIAAGRVFPSRPHAECKRVGARVELGERAEAEPRGRRHEDAHPNQARVEIAVGKPDPVKCQAR